jgi:HD-like signal output (HDOD) protein
MNAPRKKIGELLVERGYVTPEQVSHALEVQKKDSRRLGNILIELGYLDERKFHEFLSAIGGVASIELARYDIGPEILRLLPQDIALKYEAVPIGRIKNLLTIAMVYPLDHMAIEEIERVTDLRVKAVLCSRSAVYKALETHYRKTKKTEGEPPADTRAPNGHGNLEMAAQLVKRVEDLPTLPDILQAVSAIVNDPKSSASDLAKVISTDAVLSSRILRLANSPAYGLSRRVLDVKHAIALLGFKETQLLAISVSVFDYIFREASFDLKAHWNHSFACATLAKFLAAHVTSKEMESAFVAGLLHDIGKVALSTSVFAHYQRKGPTENSSASALQAEEETYGITHPEIGFLLSEHWLLPPALTHAIRYHHMPGGEPSRGSLASLIFLANIFCKLERSDAEQMCSDQQIVEAMSFLKLTEARLSQTLAMYQDIAADISVF